MSNEVEKNAKGLKGLLFGKKDKKSDAEQTSQQPARTSEKKTAQSAAPEQKKESFIVKPLQDGHLMKLWENWITSVPRPEFDFACGGREEELFGDARALLMESRMITARIEQDAQRTLRLIEQLKKMSENGEPRSMDASCFIYRPKNLMVAWMLIIPPWGPEGKFTEDVIDVALKSNNIIYGIDEEAVARLKEKPVYLTPVAVAYGTPVVPGENGKVKELFQRQLSKQIKIDEHGVADYRISNFVQAINEGQTICEIYAPIEGKPGTTVEGKNVDPAPVKPAKVPAGSNTAITEDGTRLVATISGNLEFVGKSFTVKPVLSINGDLDINIGNIDMLGDVHIRGDVRGGFSVRASGNIIIEGIVESANVEAGGDVVVVRGIVGNNNALTKAGGQVRAKFMENCIVHAGQAVMAECILSSTVYSDGIVEVVNGRGTIIGGSVTATKSVKAKVIGSEFGTATKITLGVLSYVQLQLADIKAERAVVEKELTEVERNLNFFANNPTPDNEAKASKVRLRKSILLMQYQKIVDRQNELEAMTPDLSQCRLEATVLHQQTTIGVGRYSHTTEERRNGCVMYYSTKSSEMVQA